MKTETTTPTKGHIATACKAIQKQIDKDTEMVVKKLAKIKAEEDEVEALRESIAGLSEQIAKLKGEA